MKTYQHFATVLTRLLGTDTAVRLTVPGFMPLSVEDIGQSGDGNRLDHPQNTVAVGSESRRCLAE